MQWQAAGAGQSWISSSLLVLLSLWAAAKMRIPATEMWSDIHHDSDKAWTSCRALFKLMITACCKLQAGRAAWQGFFRAWKVPQHSLHCQRLRSAWMASTPKTPAQEAALIGAPEWTPWEVGGALSARLELTRPESRCVTVSVSPINAWGLFKIKPFQS